MKKNMKKQIIVLVSLLSLFTVQASTAKNTDLSFIAYILGKYNLKPQDCFYADQNAENREAAIELNINAL